MADEESREKSKANQITAIVVPRGKPKSGRIWKDEKDKKSTIINVKPLRSSWKKKQKDKMEKKLLKVYEKELKESATKEKEARQKRLEEKRKKKEENEKKSQVVQVINNTSKIKRMKKKHLRQLQTR